METWSNHTNRHEQIDRRTILEATKKFAEIPRPEFDVLLFTEESFAAAKEHIEEREKFSSASPVMGVGAIAGTPFEVLASKADLLLRAMKLKDEGKRSAVVL